MKMTYPILKKVAYTTLVLAIIVILIFIMDLLRQVRHGFF